MLGIVVPRSAAFKCISLESPRSARGYCMARVCCFIATKESVGRMIPVCDMLKEEALVAVGGNDLHKLVP